MASRGRPVSLNFFKNFCNNYPPAQLLPFHLGSSFIEGRRYHSFCRRCSHLEEAVDTVTSQIVTEVGFEPTAFVLNAARFTNSATDAQ